MLVGIDSDLNKHLRQRRTSQLAPWEFRVVALIGGLLAVAITWCFLFQVRYSATMLEYYLKFLPAFADGGLASVFDFTGMGDPRPRLITNLIGYINVTLRQRILAASIIHPSLSISWILYPLSLVLLFKGVYRLTGQTRSAVIATLLYACSPALLDTLVNYYIPAKALANAMMLLALFGCTLIWPHASTGIPSRPIVGSTLLLFAGLLGLLCDETAIFIFICLPIVFAGALFSRTVHWFPKSIFVGGLGLALVAFAFICLLVLPWVNQRLGQIPLDFPATVTKGVYYVMFGYEPTTLVNLAEKYSPAGLLTTIVSAHTVPGRTVSTIWTSAFPLPSIFEWSWYNQLSAVFFSLLLLFFLIKTTPETRRIVCRLLAAMLVFVLFQAFLMLRLAPWIVEVNYYAAYSSIFFATIMGCLLGTTITNSRNSVSLFPWAVAAYLAVVQFVNYEATAQRHPNFDKTELTWSKLRNVYGEVQNNDFWEVVANHPFPSRLFLFAFELEVARRHARGEKVDIQPFAALENTVYGAIELDKIADPAIAGDRVGSPPREQDLINAGIKAQRQEELTSIISSRVFHGEVGPWIYSLSVDSTGHGKQRIWRRGLMRVWEDRGTIKQRESETCFAFERTGWQCFSRSYLHGNKYFAFGSDGRLVGYFK